MEDVCVIPQMKQFQFKNVIYLQSVISISSMWAAGIWHFPYEAFVALKALPHDILYNTKIHVSKKTNFYNSMV